MNINQLVIQSISEIHLLHFVALLYIVYIVD